MGKPKNQVSIRTAKKMNKEIRASTSLSNPIIKTQPSKVKARLPKKNPSKQATSGKALKPEASPHFIHIEGEQWIKTIHKQTQAKKVVMKKQALKSLSKKKGRA